MPEAETEKRIALVVGDIDGTILDPQKNLTPGTPAAVQRLYAAGIRFTLASARPPRLVGHLIRELHVSEPVACFNGALFVDPQRGVMHQIPMETSDAQFVADHLCRNGLALWLYTGTEWYVSNPNGPHVTHQEELMECKAAPLHTYDMSQYHVLKLVGVSDDYDAVARAQAYLDQLSGLAISATRSSNYYLDVTHAAANKGEVILALSRMLHIPREQIAVIGDMDTDVLAFRQAGLSIAMGNASPSVKAAAMYVTRSNTEDGVAYAIDHFILNPIQDLVAAD